MTLEQLEKEILLRIIQVSEGNIPCHEAERLIKEAFEEYKDGWDKTNNKTFINKFFRK